MTNTEREELILKMAKAIVLAENASPLRIALAVAEPVIREQCARIADEYSAEVKVSKFATATNALCAQKMAKDIAAAIREGGK